MDRLIVERKLDSLQRCIERVASRRPPRAVHAIATDRLQDFKAFARTVAAQLDAEK